MVTYKVLGQDGAGHTSSRPAAAGCCVELTGLIAKRPSLCYPLSARRQRTPVARREKHGRLSLNNEGGGEVLDTLNYHPKPYHRS